MIATSRFLTVYGLLAAAGLYIHLHSDITVPMNRPFSGFPKVIKGWNMVSESRFSEDVLNMLKPTDYLYRSYVGENGRQVQLYIGYHGGGKDGGGIHSPKHCLPGSGWYEASTKKSSLDAGGTNLNLVESVYQKGERKELFLYWFQVKDRSFTSEFHLKLAEVTNSMLFRRRDASFVRISVEVQESVEQTRAIGEQFVRESFPSMRVFLPM